MSQLNPGRFTDDQQRQLASNLVSVVEKFAPDWTNHSDSDPGVTILQLFSWLLDTLDYRVDRVSDRKRDLLKNLMAKLAAASSGACTTSDLTRPRYFYGQLLTAADLDAEQDYNRKMRWLHNRCLFGTGVVNGLSVTLDPSSSKKDEPVIVVTPGCAIAPDGQLLCLCAPLRCILYSCGVTGYVVLRYVERAIAPVPTASGSTEYSRIEEGVAVSFEEQPLGDGVAIARLKRKAGRWSLDRQFRSQRVATRTS